MTEWRSLTYAAVRRIKEHSMPCWHQDSVSSRGRNETRVVDTSRRQRASNANIDTKLCPCVVEAWPIQLGICPRDMDGVAPSM